MLAGLPQNPSRHNPAVNPKRAKLRQEQVLRRLRDLGDIDAAQYAQAVAEPLRVHSRPQEFGTHFLPTRPARLPSHPSSTMGPERIATARPFGPARLGR